MAMLKPGVTVTQDSPLLTVENPLAPGRHRFQLEVVDTAGLVSEPALLVVSVAALPDPAPEPEPDPDPRATRRGTVTLDPRILTRLAERRIVTPINPRKPR
jgi:hypothetical protein